MGERQAKVGDPDLLPDVLNTAPDLVLVDRDRVVRETERLMV